MVSLTLGLPGSTHRTLLLTICVVAVALAGCVGDDAAPAPANENGAPPAESGTAKGGSSASGGAGSGSAPTTNTTTAAAPPNATAPVPPVVARKAAVVQLSSCLEYRNVVTVPLTTVGLDLPEGFVVQTSDPAGMLVDIVMQARLCGASAFENTDVSALPEEELTAEMWTGVAVTAPAALNPADGAQYWPITWSVASERLMEVYQAWGLSSFAIAATSYVTVFNDVDAARYEALFMEPSPGRYRFDLAFAKGQSGFTLGTNNVWIPGDDGPLGYVTLESSGGNAFGSGSGWVRQNGDSSFPTLLPVRSAYVEDVSTRTTVALV